jgi:regulator of replication initiation timing
VKCGECGAWYGSKVWHSTDKYRRVIWQCNAKFKGKDKCATPHLNEESIKRLFVSAVNKLLADKDEMIANFDMIKQALFDTSKLEAERTALQSETAVVAEMIQKCVEENARYALDQTEYQQRYDGLVERYDKAKARFEEVSEQVSTTKARGEIMESFIADLRSQESLITEFDERLWCSLLDFATVYTADDVRFTFKNGTEIKA